jgi:HK97 family phage prohead protease
MPYFISDKNPDCPGWAVEKEDGEVIGCHQTKQDAVDQMVAVSLAEDMQPGGERELPDNYRPALSEDVLEGRACGNCRFFDESRVEGEGDQLKAWCERWSEFVDGGFYCNAWQPDDDTDGEDLRQVDLSLPRYIRQAAARGIELHQEGLSGDVVARTVREARLMAAGEVSEDKVIRANAWGQRHLVDLDAAQNSDSNDDGWPGRGAVAFYLWGIDPLNPEPAMAWFAQKAEQIREEEDRSFVFWRQDASVPAVEQVETRRISFNEFELREAGEGMTFSGYAAVFNQDSEPLPFTERIAPGAFGRSLRSRNNVRMYMNHDSSMLLATTRAKTLRLVEDDYGLRVEADLPDTTVGRDLAVLMRRGDVDSMSFGFTVPKGGDNWSDDGSLRTLKQIRLFEVSVVTGFPAYTGTKAAVRSLDDLATRTGQDAGQLANALSVLEAGENLTTDQAALLRDTVTKLTSVDTPVTTPVDVLRKRLALQAKIL